MCRNRNMRSHVRCATDLALLQYFIHIVRQTHGPLIAIHQNSFQLTGREVAPINMQLPNDFLGNQYTRIYRIPLPDRFSTRKSARMIKLTQTILLAREAQAAPGQIRTLIRKAPPKYEAERAGRTTDFGRPVPFSSSGISTPRLRSVRMLRVKSHRPLGTSNAPSRNKPGISASGAKAVDGPRAPKFPSEYPLHSEHDPSDHHQT